MPGLCGALGSTGCDIDCLRDGLQWSGREVAFDAEEGDVRVSVAVHANAAGAGDQPARAPGGALVWLWGAVRGHDGPDGYVPVTGPDRERPAAYCADLYDRFGMEFVEGTNGTFAGVVYDPRHDVVHLFSDRMGSHPLYCARTGDGLVFSSNVQSLAVAVDAAFEEAYLPEYFTTGRISGTRTPFVGIEEVPPSSVVTVDLATGDVTTERYWTPRYRPVDRPFSAFVDEFVETFETVMDEYLDDERRPGVLLSGGSDSRLLLAGAADRDPVAYHLSDWMSEEANVAERAAHAADCPFVWLKRDRDHHRRCLEENPSMMPFYGRFDQGHTAGFDDRLAEEVDVLVSGLYADVLFKATTLPNPTVDLGPLGGFTLPVERSTDSVGEYVERAAEPLPPFLDVPETTREVFEANVRETVGGIDHHGVVYPSLRELVSLREFYPMSNDPDLFYFGLTQSMPHWTPFLDNRMIDLALRFPIKYQLRRDIVNEAIARLSPALAAVPHASTGVALDRSFVSQYVGTYLTSVRRRRRRDEPDVPYYGHRPWVHGPELLRHDRFAIEVILERRDLIEALPFLDWDGVLDCYRRHVNGENFFWELFMLLGFLEMPGVERLAGIRTADRPHSVPGVDVDITFEDVA